LESINTSAKCQKNIKLAVWKFQQKQIKNNPEKILIDEMFHKIPFDTSLLIKTTWDFCP
jgi:hypothetical protein